MSALSIEAILARLQAIKREPSTRMPVVLAGRTFRKCAKCGQQGWHPQASAEICCGQSMKLIEHPAMTVPDYVVFIGCPKSYASGEISKADVLDMMQKDGVQACSS